MFPKHNFDEVRPKSTLYMNLMDCRWSFGVLLCAATTRSVPSRRSYALTRSLTTLFTPIEWFVIY